MCQINIIIIKFTKGAHSRLYIYIYERMTIRVEKLLKGHTYILKYVYMYDNFRALSWSTTHLFNI